MSFKKCGSVVGGDDPNFQGERFDCPNYATRRSDIYESFSVYVCDVDHERLEPWMEDDIEDLPEAAAARAANLKRVAATASGSDTSS